MARWLILVDFSCLVIYFKSINYNPSINIGSTNINHLVQYGSEGITTSHNHTRNQSSLFDVSHMVFE